MEKLNTEVCVHTVLEKESGNLRGNDGRYAELLGLQVSLFNGRKAVEDRVRVGLENDGACHVERMVRRLSNDGFDNVIKETSGWNQRLNYAL